MLFCSHTVSILFALAAVGGISLGERPCLFSVPLPGARLTSPWFLIGTGASKSSGSGNRSLPEHCDCSGVDLTLGFFENQLPDCGSHFREKRLFLSSWTWSLEDLVSA